MDASIEYIFGPGDGTTTRWSSIADLSLGETLGAYGPGSGSGGPAGRDAVGLDFDGDGRRDDAMWDTDGDGVADVAALDTDDDGEPDTFYRDSGSGLWDRRTPVHELTAARHEEPPLPAEPPERPVEPSAPRVLRLDPDGDGTAEVELVGAGAGGRLDRAERLYVDSDGDGAHDAVLVDLDSDGVADAVYDKRDPRFSRRGR